MGMGSGPGRVRISCTGDTLSVLGQCVSRALSMWIGGDGFRAWSCVGFLRGGLSVFGVSGTLLGFLRGGFSVFGVSGALLRIAVMGMGGGFDVCGWGL